MSSRFRYPTGVRALLIEEAARRRRVETRFVAALEDEGFAEVVLPIIDYLDPYGPLIDRQAASQSYRFVDRDGELVAIRSDFTPMLARALAPALRENDLPLRVFYRGDVIRCDASRLGVNRELFQIGAEVIGDARVECDLNILRIALELARPFGGHPTIVYNDVSIVERLGEAAPVVREALVAKRMSDAIHAPLRDFVARLIMGDARVEDVRPFAPDAATRLDVIARALPSESFVLHLDDVDETPSYYTGLRFRVYGGSTRTKIAEGGRYDSLYGRFGMDAPAIGFTFTIDGSATASESRRLAGARR